MKINQRCCLVLLAAMLMSTVACSSFSVSSKAGTIEVENKPKQPNVIVNAKIKVYSALEKT